MDRREVYRFIAEHGELPAPKRITIADSGVVFMDFQTLEELEVWAAHLNAAASRRRELSDDGVLCSYYTFGKVFLGYHGALSCQERPRTVSQERTEAILARLNGFIVHEYQDGTELVDGRAVPVSDIVGTDFNLEEAVSWARTQPELESFTEPAFPSLLQIRLVDGTVLFWDTGENRWHVDLNSGGA